MNKRKQEYLTEMYKLKEHIPQQIWIARVPLKFYGFECGTRMTVIKLSNGELFIHSPVKITKTIQQQINKIGNVKYIVSPTRIHHLFMGEWQEAYPKAKLYASPGLVGKRPDLSFVATLSDKPEKTWAKDVDQVVFKGHPIVQEVAFFHKKSKTLILADLLEHATEEYGLGLRIVAKLAGMWRKPSPPSDFIWTIKDKRAAKQSAVKILQWPFQRIIISHGKLIEKNAKEVFKEGFKWALKK